MKTILFAASSSLALLLSIGCQDGAGELSTDVQPANIAAAIDTWETNLDGEKPVLQALSESGEVLAEMALQSDVPDGVAESVTLSFLLPESGDVRVTRQGVIEGDVRQELLDIARAAYEEFPSTDLSKEEPVVLEAPTDDSVEKSTASGSFRVDGGLFGTSDSRVVGNLCPSRETRTNFRVRETDKTVFGGNCDGEGFENSDEHDCQIRISFSAGGAFSSVRCRWEVNSRPSN